MKLQADITTKVFYGWLGIRVVPQFISPSRKVNIVKIRDLYTRLCDLPFNERQQVVAWGLWVEDVTIVQMLAWAQWRCVNRIVEHNFTSLNDKDNLHALLFAPYLVPKKQVADASFLRLADV